VPRVLALTCLLLGCSDPAVPASDPSSMCEAVEFTKQEFMSRSGFNYGDSWMMSWAADGRTFTNFSDGRLTSESPKQSNAILVVADDPPALTPSSFQPVSGDPLEIAHSWAHYIISTVFVRDTMYVGMIDFSENSGIARSDDFGRTLVYDRSRPMWPGDGVKPFAYASFLQHGRGYSGNQDGYLYVYATDGQWGGQNSLRLGRVRIDADVLDPSNYAYFDGEGWSEDLSRAADLLPTSSALGGMQSIVYNPILERYFLITFGEPKQASARMVLFDAPEPWGPWFHCGDIARDQALFLDEPVQTAIYNPSFNAKWIDADGSMWISYASCCDPAQYTFTYGRVTIVPRQVPSLR
jgi:hypothetical protein